LKVKLDDHEYEIRVPAKVLGYMQIVSTPAKTGVDADAVAEAIEKILSVCCEPKPCHEHELEVLGIIIEKYGEKLTKTFRPR
jgi:hypothetical protein